MLRIAKRVKWGYLVIPILVISLTLLSSQHFVVKAAGNLQPTPTPIPFVFPPNLTGNFAGYQALGPLNAFDKMQASFIVPTLDLKQSKPGDMVHLAVALGGNPKLTNPQFLTVGAGVKSMVDPSGQQQNEFWWIPAVPKEQLLPSKRGIHAGDTIDVTIQSNVNNDNDFVFTFLDKTTGETQSEHLAGHQYQSDGSAGACFLERPYITDKTTGASTGTPFATLLQPVKFLSCSLASSNNTAVLAPIGSLPNVQKINISRRVSPNPAPPTAQTEDIVILTATGVLDATKQSFVIAPANQVVTVHRGLA